MKPTVDHVLNDRLAVERLLFRCRSVYKATQSPTLGLAIQEIERLSKKVSKYSGLYELDRMIANGEWPANKCIEEA